ERQQHADDRHDDGQHEQVPAPRGREGERHRQHQVSTPLSGVFAAASGLSVVRPVSWKSRSSNATASAVAEEATTMPVMPIACGTGSAAKPAAAPLRAMMPNIRKTPLPRMLKARIL